MLQFISIRHQYGAKILFDGFSWHIKPNSKIGLIGPNGIGKTTLFHFALGLSKPDEGEIIKSKETKISLFHQIPLFNPDQIVLETILSSNKLYSEYLSKRTDIEAQLENSNESNLETLLEIQSKLEDFANENDLHNLETGAKKILSGLGFTDSEFSKKTGDFSPGFQHRIGLAIALLNPHNLLLLDEPTNHLDDKSKQWLSEYLKATKSNFVLVTHDPEFLNSCTNLIAEISPNGVTEFKGSLEEFLEEKNEIHEKLKQRFKKEESYLQKRNEWIERFRSKATKARQVQSAIKKLEKRDKIENPEEIFWNKKPDYNFNFIPSGKLILRLEEVGFQYNSSGKWIFQNTNLEVNSGDKIAIVGPNGAGKSTLLKAIAGYTSFTNGKFNLGPKTKIGYFSQVHHEELDPKLNLVETILKSYPLLNDEKARNALGHFSFSGDSVFKSTSSLSGGEMSRLRLAMLVLEPVNLLILDEPTNHLDIVIRNSLKHALSEFPGSVLVVSHDPSFLDGLCNRTLEVSSGKVNDLNCNFNDYLNYHQESDIISKNDIKVTSSADDFAKRNQEKNKSKKILKEIQLIEEKISFLEKKVYDQESLMSSGEFYQTPDFKEKLVILENYKKEILELTEKWEVLSLQLG
ncbi:MAG: ABC-F family ATP-binding cassette domain-containing protein [Leptospiraceae bacterium]|nr:ABC-F family ATP-binding cassette domain-containing protein [Leptospiraceae bacterium]